MTTPTPESGGQPEPSVPPPPAQPVFGGSTPETAPIPAGGPPAAEVAGRTDAAEFAGQANAAGPSTDAGNGSDLPPASPVIEGGSDGSGGGGRKKGLLVGGAAVAVLAVVAGGAFAVQNVMGGGGAQPEDALPATTAAFAKVDLDPSGGQKVDAIRFLRKFPDARDKVSGEDADLRKVVFESIQDEGVLQDVDYAADIEPWLGQRFGVGVVPGDAGAEPNVAVALSITDRGKAQDAIDKLADSAQVACDVGDDYAVCTKDQEQLDTILAQTKDGTLADADTFSQDMGDLGEDGIVTAWSDFDAAKSLIEDAVDASGAPVAVPDSSLDQISGRAAMALRFDGPNLELAGRLVDLPENAQFDGDDKASVESLPEDTLAAFSAGGIGARIEQSWPQILEQAGDSAEVQGQIDEIEAQTGLVLPDDLVAALGSRLTVAFGGISEGGDLPDVALVTDGDRAVLDKIANDVLPQLTGTPLVLTEDGDDTVLSLSDAYGKKVADGSGFQDSEAFKNAVPNADGAQVVAFADIAGIVESLGTMGDDEALDALSAFGMSASTDGGTAEFALRLTTK